MKLFTRTVESGVRIQSRNIPKGRHESKDSLVIAILSIAVHVTIPNQWTGCDASRSRRTSVSRPAVESASALEILKRENELLKSTLEEAGADASAYQYENAVIPEDIWSPAATVPDDHVFIEQYGSPSEIPNHDGTECFKWDNTMWSAAEHFKVLLCSL
jgi:1,4-alpha-glucan branching enzyme